MDQSYCPKNSTKNYQKYTSRRNFKAIKSILFPCFGRFYSYHIRAYKSCRESEKRARRLSLAHFSLCRGVDYVYHVSIKTIDFKGSPRVLTLTHSTSDSCTGTSSYATRRLAFKLQIDVSIIYGPSSRIQAEQHSHREPSFLRVCERSNY